MKMKEKLELDLMVGYNMQVNDINILAINTGFKNSYVALKKGSMEVFKTSESSLKQSENIMGLIDECLNVVNIKPKELNAIACVIGPGSFTGLRIGISICNGMTAPFEHINKVEINSLDLLAFKYSKNAESDFYVLISGGSNKSYICKYNKNGERISAQLCDENNINKENLIVVGLEQDSGMMCDISLKYTSEDLLEYAKFLVQNNNFSKTYIPVYLKESQAEENASKKTQN